MTTNDTPARGRALTVAAVPTLLGAALVAAGWWIDGWRPLDGWRPAELTWWIGSTVRGLGYLTILRAGVAAVRSLRRRPAAAAG